MFGYSPKIVMTNEAVTRRYEDVAYSADQIDSYINKVLQLEAVARKDWLTNKVDRSVTDKITCQQCQGEVQLPFSDRGTVVLDYHGKRGIVTVLGYAP